MSFSFLDSLFDSLNNNTYRSGNSAFDQNAQKQKKEENEMKENKKILKKKNVRKDNEKKSGSTFIIDPFKTAYETLEGSRPKRGEGLSTILPIADNEDILSNKLKGKNFLLKKNEVRRGKKHRKSDRIKKIIKTKKLFELEKMTYEDYKFMIELWEEYVLKLIGSICNFNDSVYLKLCRGDFHGAYISIVKSKVKSNQGIEGIVVMESLKSFVLLTKKDKVKRVLKQNIIFTFQVKKKTFMMLGAALIYRPDERIRIKPKIKNFLPKLREIFE